MDGPPGWHEVANGDLVVIDLETTGRYLPPHRVCEIAIVRLHNGRVVDEYVSLVNPERPTGTDYVHGIMNRDVRNAPHFVDIADDVISRLSDATIVAHGAAFDEQFLAQEFAIAGRDVPMLPALCTHELSRAVRSRRADHRLDALCAAYGVPLIDAHTALGDARATAWALTPLLRTALELGVHPATAVAPIALPQTPSATAPDIREQYRPLGPGAAIGTGTVQPGWYPDPAPGGEHRWWDGHVWTNEIARGGVHRTDAVIDLADPTSLPPAEYAPNLER